MDNGHATKIIRKKIFQRSKGLDSSIKELQKNNLKYESGWRSFIAIARRVSQQQIRIKVQPLQI